jgi:prepilin-type N-terminal cleavage/methylation domain-containing protein
MSLFQSGRFARSTMGAPSAHQAGFSLVEVLISSVVGVICLAALFTVIISYVRSRDRLESMQRLQDQWGRLQFLLDREIQEATPVTASSTASGSCGAGTVVLALEVPGNNKRILYYLSGTSLRRCGPVITSNGDLGATVSDALLLDGVTRFTVNTSDPQLPTYSLTLTDPNGVSYTNQSKPSATAFRSRTIQ